MNVLRGQPCISCLMPYKRSAWEAYMVTDKDPGLASPYRRVVLTQTFFAALPYEFVLRKGRATSSSYTLLGLHGC